MANHNGIFPFLVSTVVGAPDSTKNLTTFRKPAWKDKTRVMLNYSTFPQFLLLHFKKCFVHVRMLNEMFSIFGFSAKLQHLNIFLKKGVEKVDKLQT